MKLEIQLEILVKTALSIGSGIASPGMGIDKSTIRDADGHLIIPASTIKGKVRSECERILRGINPEIICRPPKAEEMCPHYDLPGEKDKPVYERDVCPICKLFGTTGRKARLLFSDATLDMKTKLEREKLEGVDSQIRPGVTISRKRRTAEDERLYFIETSSPKAGFIFKGVIQGNIQSNKEVALILAGIRNVPALGGGKSRGMGWIGIREEILIDNVRMDTKQLLNYIEEWRS